MLFQADVLKFPGHALQLKIVQDVLGRFVDRRITIQFLAQCIQTDILAHQSALDSPDWLRGMGHRPIKDWTPGNGSSVLGG